jgi:hypothetical protein
MLTRWLHSQNITGLHMQLLVEPRCNVVITVRPPLQTAGFTFITGCYDGLTQQSMPFRA